MSSASPFDALAPDYDAEFTHTSLGAALRERAHARLSACFPPGAHVLELGCGTGEDAARLAARGLRVLATDSSAAMLAEARAKTAGIPSVVFTHLDLNAPAADFAPDLIFDGAFSNFGPLNCVADRPALARWLAPRLHAGGVLAAAVMSPFCLWETLWHGLHGDVRTATRRWHGPTTFQLAPDEAPLHVDYPSVKQIAREFTPGFRFRRVLPLGVVIPPTALFAVVERRPRLRRMLLAGEGRLGDWSLLARLADHYWIEFERV